MQFPPIYLRLIVYFFFVWTQKLQIKKKRTKEHSTEMYKNLLCAFWRWSKPNQVGLMKGRICWMNQIQVEGWFEKKNNFKTDQCHGVNLEKVEWSGVEDSEQFYTQMAQKRKSVLWKIGWCLIFLRPLSFSAHFQNAMHLHPELKMSPPGWRQSLIESLVLLSRMKQLKGLSVEWRRMKSGFLPSSEDAESGFHKSFQFSQLKIQYSRLIEFEWKAS